jgi:hypothetical protein
MGLGLGNLGDRECPYGFTAGVPETDDTTLITHLAEHIIPQLRTTVEQVHNLLLQITIVQRTSLQGLVKQLLAFGMRLVTRTLQYSCPDVIMEASIRQNMPTMQPIASSSCPTMRAMV